MKITDLMVFYLLGAATGSAIVRREDEYDDKKVDDYKEEKAYDDSYSDDKYKKYDDDKHKPWKPKTKEPHFFQLKVDEDEGCLAQPAPLPLPLPITPAPVNPIAPLLNGPFIAPVAAPVVVPVKRQILPVPDPTFCFEGYAVRLDKGRAIATPYNKWWDPPLATFFVDDDTQFYTVSKQPLQLYVDAVSGALRYTKVGWLPPNSISISFYHTGTNPLGVVNGDSPSLLTWPSTPFNTPSDGTWLLCPDGQTGQWSIWVNDFNFKPQGPIKSDCIYRKLAAVNANPWKKKGSYYGYKKRDAAYGEDSYVEPSYADPSYGEEPAYESDSGSDAEYGYEPADDYGYETEDYDYSYVKRNDGYGDGYSTTYGDEEYVEEDPYGYGDDYEEDYDYEYDYGYPYAK